MDKEQVIKTTITFVVLLVAGIALAVSSRFLQQPIEQMVMVGVGSALIGGSLAFYLNQMFNLNRETAGIGRYRPRSAARHGAFGD